MAEVVSNQTENDTLECTFVTEKDTKGTRRFTEVHEDGRAPIGSLYITKEFLDKIGNPTNITVTVSAS